MKWQYKIFTLVILLVLAACTSQANEPASETAVTTDESASETMADDEMMADEEDMADENMADEDMEHDDEMMEEETMSDEDMKHDDEMMEEETMSDEDMEHDDEMADEGMEHDDEMMDEGDEAMMEDDEMMADYPAWQTIALTDVTTGESFTLADFAGKTVFVEPMATWCSNCRRQLGYVKEARDQLNNEDIIFVGISVETTIDDATLASYTEETGYNWTFAVATPEMLQSLVAQFGQTITNPPSTPHFIINPDGTATDLVTGFETADELIPQLQG